MSLQNERLTIAIDYDGTFAADPTLFKNLIQTMKAFGHRVIMVTGREDIPEMANPVREAVQGLIPIVFSAGHWKVDAARRAGYIVDIWVDDNPSYIRPPQTLVEIREDLRKHQNNFFTRPQ